MSLRLQVRLGDGQRGLMHLAVDLLAHQRVKHEHALPSRAVSVTERLITSVID